MGLPIFFRHQGYDWGSTDLGKSFSQLEIYLEEEKQPRGLTSSREFISPSMVMTRVIFWSIWERWQLIGTGFGTTCVP